MEPILSEREVRIQKIKKMQHLGVIPFAQKYDKTHHIADIIQQFEKADLRDIETIIPNPEVQVSTAWRLTLYRSHGKLAFARLLDSTEQIQLMFHRDNCNILMNGEKKSELPQSADSLDKGRGRRTNEGADEERTTEEGFATTMTAYKFIEKLVDIGDFIGVKGEVFRTHKGELTIFVSEFSFLSKSIRGLPEKYHGLTDPEELYRKRYLDMTMNPETYKRFLFKSKFYQTLREFYTKEGFTEIQTPILDNAASGAAARPFITHHNDYDTDVYLRIAFETSLKKATVGRFEKVFEIGQDFRNEGSDPSHLQEFTQVEHYAVYRNYEDNMKFMEKMCDYLFEKLNLNKKLKVKDRDGVVKEVDFTTPRERIDYTKGINEASGLDIEKYTEADADQLRADIKTKGIEFEGMDDMGTPTLIDYLFKKVLRPKILGPAFIYNYPVIMQPLARISDKDANIVEQFQCIVNGREMCKAYSELVDPLLQQANFDKQAESWDDEATAGDDAFVEAMEYGMPPQSGFGMGLERMLAILTEQDNLRDVVMFPLMKPRNDNNEEEKPTFKVDKKEVKVATIILNKGLWMEARQELNTVGHLSASFAGRVGKSLFMADSITTQDQENLKLNMQHAIMVKQSPNQKTIVESLQKAKKLGLETAEFTREMLQTSDDKKVIEVTAKKKFEDIELLWILLFGEKKTVDELTKDFPLYA